VESVDDIHRILTDWPIGRPLPVVVIRGQEKIEISIEPTDPGLVHGK